jgi:hypothetical protein
MDGMGWSRRDAPNPSSRRSQEHTMLVGFGALTGNPFALTGARVPSLSPLRCSRWIYFAFISAHIHFIANTKLVARYFVVQEGEGMASMVVEGHILHSKGGGRREKGGRDKPSLS